MLHISDDSCQDYLEALCDAHSLSWNSIWQTQDLCLEEHSFVNDFGNQLEVSAHSSFSKGQKSVCDMERMVCIAVVITAAPHPHAHALNHCLSFSSVQAYLLQGLQPSKTQQAVCCICYSK